MKKRLPPLPIPFLIQIAILVNTLLNGTNFSLQYSRDANFSLQYSRYPNEIQTPPNIPIPQIFCPLEQAENQEKSNP